MSGKIQDILDNLRAKQKSVPSKLINKLADDTIAVLRNQGWDSATHVAMKSIIKKSLENKATLRAVLSTHPDWSEKDLAIVGYVNEIRFEFDEEVESFFQEPLNACGARRYREKGHDWLKAEPENARWIVNQISCWKALIKGAINAGTPVISPERGDQLKSYGYKQVKVDQKLSRAIREWSEHIQYVNCNGFEKLYAKLSDALNPRTFKRRRLISINPIDFLLSAHGNNWRSCHTITKSYEDGCYRVGSLSYMLDNASFVHFTLKETEQELHLAKRLTRTMLHFEDGLTIRARIYPHNTNKVLQETYNKDTLDVICKCLGLPVNAPFRIGHGMEEVASYCYEDHRWMNYPDYLYEQCHGSVFVPKGFEDIPTKIQIGHEAHCVRCGRSNRDKLKLDCCVSNATPRCAICEKQIFNGRYILPKKPGTFCSECAFCCCMCGSSHLRNNENHFKTSKGSTCAKCTEKYFFLCCICGEYHSRISYRYAIYHRDGSSDLCCGKCSAPYTCVKCDIRYSFTPEKCNTCNHSPGDEIPTCTTCGGKAFNTREFNDKTYDYCRGCYAHHESTRWEDTIIGRNDTIVMYRTPYGDEYSMPIDQNNSSG
jgi:hypothetical protein